MSLSDCIKCWDTPCECGWDYRDWTTGRLIEFRTMIETIIRYKINHPNAKFSNLSGKEETQDDKDLMEHVKNELYYTTKE